MKKGIFILAVLPWLAFACSKEPVKVDRGTGQQINRKLTVEVKHRYNIVAAQDSLLPNVTIKMFLDPTDRDEDLRIEKQRTTNYDGKAIFEYLDDTTFYVRLEHDSLGTLDRNITITDQTSSAFEYFLYY